MVFVTAARVRRDSAAENDEDRRRSGAAQMDERAAAPRRTRCEYAPDGTRAARGRPLGRFSRERHTAMFKGRCVEDGSAALDFVVAWEVQFRWGFVSHWHMRALWGCLRAACRRVGA